MNRPPDAGGFSLQVLQAVRSVAGEQGAVLHEPTIGGNEERNIKDCLKSTFVASGGQYVDRFETDLARYTGSAHVVAVASGTAALQVALRLVGVGVGDEGLVPALTFVQSPISEASPISSIARGPHSDWIPQHWVNIWKRIPRYVMVRVLIAPLVAQ